MPSWKEIMSRNNFANLERMKGKVIVGTIERVEIDDKGYKGNGKQRFIIDLDSTEMRFNLNLESCIALGSEYGDDTDDWVGKKVRCFVGQVAFGKGKVPGILVNPEKGKVKGK